jgi:hypothetical protein
MGKVGSQKKEINAEQPAILTCYNSTRSCLSFVFWSLDDMMPATQTFIG